MQCNFILTLNNYSKKLLFKDISYIKLFFTNILISKCFFISKKIVKFHVLRSPFTFKNSFEKYALNIHSKVFYLKFFKLNLVFLKSIESSLLFCLTGIESNSRLQKQLIGCSSANLKYNVEESL